MRTSGVPKANLLPGTMRGAGKPLHAATTKRTESPAVEAQKKTTAQRLAFKA